MSLLLTGAGSSGRGYQNLLAWTEYDINDHLTVTPNLADANGITRNEDVFLYKDMGVGGITDFVHEVKWTPRASDVYSLVAVWWVSNVVEDLLYWENNSSEALNWNVFYLPYRTGLGDYETGDTDFDAWEWTDGIEYWLRFERFGTAFTARVFADAARTTLLKMNSITIGATAYQYVGVVNSYNDADPTAISFDVADVNLSGTPTP